MPTKLGFALILFIVIASGCSKILVGAPKSSNPAHCIAAFNYGRGVLLRGSNPDIHGALGMAAREVFESLTLQRAGALARGVEEAKALSVKYGSNKDIMMTLLKECLARQDNNPDFKAANDNGSLMTIARHVDPRCKGNHACETGAIYQ